MVDGLIVSAILSSVLLLLAAEAVLLRYVRNRIPKRIAVTGTRGKSSVARLIAAGLRAGGHRVVCKTTGSRAILSDVDGREHTVRRRSLPTPLEQRRLLVSAAGAEAAVLVVEAMSVRPESLRVELRRIVIPHIVVITNVRADHLAALEDPDRAFADAVPPEATVIHPQDLSAGLVKRLSRPPARDCVPVDVKRTEALLSELSYTEWPENLALALAACAAVGVDEDVALSGMTRAAPDIGAFAAWRWEGVGGRYVVVNGFAANDPESTLGVLRMATERWPGGVRIGVLNLRADRGDRTIQWLRVLERGEPVFDRLVLAGDVPLLTIRSLRRCYGERLIVSRRKRPERVLAAAVAGLDNGMVFGFGNIGGIGLRLVELWSKRGVLLDP